MGLRSLALFSLVIFLTLPARADILFIDLNCSASEIAAAQKAAVARGEKLVVLPPRTAQQQRVFAELHDLDLEEGALLTSGRPALKALTSIHAKQARLQAQAKALGTPSFGVQQIKSILRAYAHSRRTFETIIISGHHGGNTFFGQFGSLNNQISISESFAKYPALLNAVHSLYGWGCYTNTPAEATEWQTAFPGLKVTGGFDGSAPGSETPPDSGFLGALLAKEATLDRMSDEKASQASADRIASLIRSLQDFNRTNASVCTCGECVGVKTGEISLKNPGGCDFQALGSLRMAFDRIRAVFNGLADIPCNTQNSDLRTFYNLARQKSYCAKSNVPLSSQFDYYTGRADQALRLIYLRQVVKNFALYYKDALQKAAEIETRCAISDSALSDLSRPLACNPPDQNPPNALHMSALWQGQYGVPGKDCDPKDLAREVKLRCHLSNLYTVPARWVEPASKASQLEKPTDTCILPRF